MRILVLGDLHLSSRSPVSRIDDYSKTTIKKLDNLIQIVQGSNIDFIIQTGDIIHVKDISYQYLGMVLQRLDMLREATKRKLILAIVGNHDMLYRRYDSIHRTATGIFFRTGIFTLLERTMIDGIEFVGVSEGREFGKATMEKSVLVGHAFYDNKLIPRESLFESQIKELGYKWVMLGHDHVPYPPKVVGETFIIRPGALMRGTTHKYNMYREVKVDILDTEAVEGGTVQSVALNVEPADKVLRAMGSKDKDVREDIDDVLTKLFTGGVQTTVGYVRDTYMRIRDEIKGDKDLVQYLDLKFTERGLI